MKLNLRMELDFNQLALVLKENRNDANFAPLYYRSKPIIENYIKYFIKNPEVANDVLSESMSIIFDKINMYDPSFKFITWAYTITRNVCIWELRRQKNLASIDEMDEVSTQKFEFNHGVTNPDYEFFEFELDQDEILSRVLKLMEVMPETYRDIIIDRELSRLSMKDLSTKYQLCENTIKTKLRCGRRWLKDSYLKKYRNHNEIRSFIQKEY